jgi:FkbM family methyltransferase
MGAKILGDTALQTGFNALVTSAWYRALGRSHRVALPGGQPFQFYTHSQRNDRVLSRAIAKHGAFEPVQAQIFCRLLRQFKTFIDLGANIGWHTVLAQHEMSSDSQIFAFEPEPKNFALLKANTHRKKLPKTTIVQSAVSDQIGTIDIHLSRRNFGDHRIYRSEDGRKSVSVPMTTLDAYFDGTSLPPLLLKSDTQGSEPHVFKSCEAGAVREPVAIRFHRRVLAAWHQVCW